MEIYWKWIVLPLAGALIGYVTNWIAVKMLFRPQKEIKLRGRRLPFTPGVIPRGKARLAKAVGRAVEEQLLTGETLKKVLLSEEKKAMVKAYADAWINSRKQSQETLREASGRLFSEESAEHFVEAAEEKATDILFEKMITMEPGKIIADKVLDIAKEKLGDSTFGMMVGGSFLEPIVRQVEEKINEYAEEKGRPFVEKIVWEESEKLQSKTVGDTLIEIEECGVDFSTLAVKQYENIVGEKLPVILENLQISSIVEDRINTMDVSEVEELMLSIMKKELGAVVNLGALIGFILGLVNAVIFYI